MSMKDPHDALRRAHEDTVLRGPGHTAPRLRQAAAERRDLPQELVALVDKIEAQAYRVTDDDIAALRARYGEDELFEILLASAMGAAMRRFAAGMKALEEA
jgi:hypothetical protein